MSETKRGAGRPRGYRDDVPVKLDRRLVDQARVIAAYRKTTLAELLSTLLEAPVERAHSRMAKELSRTTYKNSAKGAGE
ncbi:hypothetical protein [Paludisphaera mucosa]|uniref:Uncharacterized protein n=1 Tax=Paludisphaera mucosa TaxID=3030827 RepID=A0ABT6F7D3_9BACT|nr:hypothetical protein [Paludisphaera mucosa]MDG3003434.1 hypothetical protein [Paludisphaera mucosa]